MTVPEVRKAGSRERSWADLLTAIKSRSLQAKKKVKPIKFVIRADQASFVVLFFYMVAQTQQRCDHKEGSSGSGNESGGTELTKFSSKEIQTPSVLCNGEGQKLMVL